MLVATQLERVFFLKDKGQEIRLTDPEPKWSVESVRNFYANTYPMLTYTFFRIAAFDPIYNVTRGLPLTYLEGNNVWDRTMSHVQPSGMIFIRGLSFTLGASISINELGRLTRRLSN